jgi:hypothetical protein
MRTESNGHLHEWSSHFLSTMMVISEEKSIIADTGSRREKVLTFEVLSIFAFARPDIRRVSRHSAMELRFILN